MRKIILLLTIVTSVILYSKDYNLDKTYYGIVQMNEFGDYKIEKTLSHNLGELITEINYNRYEQIKDSLKLFFNTKFVNHELQSFNVYLFTEDSSGIISLIPIKICRDCNGVFDITIDKKLKELKLIVESSDYGMDYAIFKVY